MHKLMINILNSHYKPLCQFCKIKIRNEQITSELRSHVRRVFRQRVSGEVGGLLDRVAAS